MKLGKRPGGFGESKFKPLAKINLAAVAVVLVVLKLVGVIHWGWLWIFSPLWIPFALVAAIAAVVAVGYTAVIPGLIIRDLWKRRRGR